VNLRIGSFCSGICAPEVAWRDLGWEPQFFSEIDPFACAVEVHHFPNVPNLGDMTKVTDEPIKRFPVDLVVAGTPCQSFSVAGKRGGMADPRGNLALVFLGLLDRMRPRWMVWENVPGVLSSDGGRDFGVLLTGLAKCGYGFAYRILDAQYFGVPQRRRRVFVVGYLGDWRRACAVLFERQSLSGNPPPGRETGKGVAGSLAARTRGGGGLGTDFDCYRGLITGSLCADSHPGGYSGQDAYTGRLIAHSLRSEAFDASEDGTGRGTPLVAFSSKNDGGDAGGTAPTLRAMNHDASHANAGGQVAVLYNMYGGGKRSDRPEGGLYVNAEETTKTLETSGFDPALSQGGSVVHFPSGVRRLTPRECERLQGFPDDFTAIPYRGKAAADGPRYRALGNSMAVPVLRWIGQRIQTVEAVP
jgi:DNA (cytosine-5)-methyltransferase 1